MSYLDFTVWDLRAPTQTIFLPPAEQVPAGLCLTWFILLVGELNETKQHHDKSLSVYDLVLNIILSLKNRGVSRSTSPENHNEY